MSVKKNQKKEQALAAVKKLTSHDELKHLERVARALIDPGGEGPLRFPSLAPHKRGAAVFPLVVEVKSTAANPLPDFGIVVNPSLRDTLQITHPGAIPESALLISGELGMINQKQTRFTADTNCDLYSEWIGGRKAIPLSSAAGVNYQLYISAAESDARFQVFMYGWNGAAWVLIGNSGTVGGGRASQDNTGGHVYAAAYTHMSIAPAPVVALGNDVNAAITCQYLLNPTAGTWTCGGSETTMDTYAPPWGPLIDASSFFQVVAADCLVTYEGSSLENAGSIAVANVDSDFTVNGSWYDSIASLPFDKYRGRLASEGKTEGGAHWHYIPVTADQLTDQAIDGFDLERNLTSGVFGIAGLQQDQVVRVECHFMVNFYSEDPSYQMAIPPPFTGYSALLYLLRKEVPLVTSNDKHKSKLAKVRASVQKAANTTLNYAPEIIQALQLIAALL